MLGTPWVAEPARAPVHKVLVVDDEPDLADLAMALLRCHGMDIVVAYSAAEALATLGRDADIDAVFSDITMPGMTGLQLAATVGDLYPRIKIVLTSGYADPALPAWPGLRGSFIAKPYRIEAVMALLRD
jgi:two-component system OmpR family response regulator